MRNIISKKRSLILSLFCIGILLAITGVLFNSFALIEPISSISFTSSKLNYESKEPGSWKVEKSAKWISKEKARITFNIDTVFKTKGKARDIIFVLDISSSMAGEKLARVKQDSKELINVLLSNQDNRVALITFNTSSSILSGFSSNHEDLLGKIDDLRANSTTNYYQALVNVDSILKYEDLENDRESIVLFLTDGYPNVDTPNEIAQYSYLKEEYPSLIINGIQYEMGEEVLEPIKEISDNQFIADIENLNNVLFDASDDSIPYDSFVLMDYIDTDYFYTENMDDIKVSQGIVDFDKEKQKVTWTISGLKTGTNPSMTIDVNLKEGLKDIELFPTNTKEGVQSKLGEIIEDVESTLTPILKNKYQVIYEGNAPSGCIVKGVPDISTSFIFDTVEISDNSPVCEGYQFKGWKIVTADVKVLNKDYFVMPESDVILRAEWSNLSIAKSMDGTIYEYLPPILQSIASNRYNKEIWKYKLTATRIVFQNEMNAIDDAIADFDISQAKNSSVMAYVVPNEGQTTYTIYIQGLEKIIAHYNSSYLFYGFENLQEIEGLEYLDTSGVANMSYMFYYCDALIDLNVSRFDTSNVTNMSYMFYNCNGLTELDVSSFDTSKVTNMSNTFSGCRALKSLDISHFNTSSVTDMSAMFCYSNHLVGINLKNLDTSKVTTMEEMFQGCYSLVSLDVSDFDTSNVITMASMFYNCSGLKSLDTSNFNTSNVTNMEKMFYDCGSLTDLDASHFDTSKVMNMGSMFWGCSGLTSLNFSSFNTSSVTDMGSMFYECSSLSSLDVSYLDTSNVTTMGYMFNKCEALIDLDVSHFDTSNVNRMDYMFADCHSLTSIDVGNFNTSKVTNMSSMFYYCSSLVNLDLGSFDTSKVTDMENMFRFCRNLVDVNLSSFNTSSLTSLRYIFDSCSKIITTFAILNPNITASSNLLGNAARSSGSQITLNYTGETSDLVDNIIAKKYDGANIVKGIRIDHDITVEGNDDIQSNMSSAVAGSVVNLSSISGDYIVTSFKMNGTFVKGNRFVMPDVDVIISDIEVSDIIVIESEHNPYPNSLTNQVYGERTFEGATSITVVLDYQTESIYYDWIYLYDSSGKEYGKYAGKTRTTETIVIPGDYIKIVFTTDSSGNDFYGFRAAISPNYD